MIGKAEFLSFIGGTMLWASINFMALRPDIHIGIVFLLSLMALGMAFIVRRVRTKAKWQISVARRIGESIPTLVILAMATPSYIDAWSVSGILEKTYLIWVVLVAFLLIRSISCCPKQS